MVIDTHKSIGITVLGLVIVRLLWRYAHTLPHRHQRTKLGSSALRIGRIWSLYFVMF